MLRFRQNVECITAKIMFTILSSNYDYTSLKNKEFLIWDKELHKLEYIKTNGQCCFNHTMGLGITKFMLRIMAWLDTRDNSFLCC